MYSFVSNFEQIIIKHILFFDPLPFILLSLQKLSAREKCIYNRNKNIFYLETYVDHSLRSFADKGAKH